MLSLLQNSGTRSKENGDGLSQADGNCAHSLQTHRALAALSNQQWAWGTAKGFAEEMAFDQGPRQ